MCAKRVFAFGLFFALLAVQKVEARTLDFDFKDPKEISAVSLMLDSKLEPIFGYAKGISGTVSFDPARPDATTGTIAVAADSVQFANDGYTATARGFALESQKYPKIVFVLKKVVRVTRSAPNVYTGTVQADFLCKGVTLPLTVPMTASFFPGRAAERTNGKIEGDLLVLRTRFSVSRTKLGISAGIPADLVADAVEVRVSCVGIHSAPKPRSASAKIWKMEVEDRDDPTKADAEFDLTRQPPQASFRTEAGRLDALDVRRDGKKLTFRLPENPQVGECKGEAEFDGDAMHGRLVGKNETLTFHGRPRLETDAVIKSVPPQTAQGPGFQDLKIEADGKTWTLAERMKFFHVPAVSIARLENNKVVEVGAFGVANVETGEPVDENTRFQAGGMGSPLVNLLALQLAASGKLDLDKSVNAYLKAAQIPENALTNTRPVTVRDLLNGTSGLTQSKFIGYRPDAPRPTLATLLRGDDPREMAPLEVKSTPGEKIAEAGINQAVLQQVIEDACGKPLATLMQEHVFLPFGMTRSTYETHPARAALGHYSTGELMLDKIHIYPASGETGLWTTAGDFARMLCEVQKLLAGKPNWILPDDKRGLLASAAGENAFPGLHKSNVSDYVYHGGDSYGYFANHMTHLRDGTGVVVMQNRMMSWQFSNEVIDAVGRQHKMARLFSWSPQ